MFIMKLIEMDAITLRYYRKYSLMPKYQLEMSKVDYGSFMVQNILVYLLLLISYLIIL